MNRQDYLDLINPAILMVAKKGEDYNNAVTLHEYFPYGDFSYQQMMHVKMLRMRSLIEKGKAANFDSLSDSIYDLINYAVFYLDFLAKLAEDKDANRPED